LSRLQVNKAEDALYKTIQERSHSNPHMDINDERTHTQNPSNLNQNYDVPPQFDNLKGTEKDNFIRKW
jgi:hypothetical protein